MRASPMTIRQSFAVALICVSSGFAVTYLTWPLQQSTPLAVFFAAVLASAWLGGRTGGLLAVASSAVLGYYAFLPPYWTFGSDAKNLLPLAVFVLVASAIVSVIDSQR